MPGQAIASVVTDFRLITQLDGFTEPSEFVLLDNAEVVQLRDSVVDGTRIIQPDMVP